MLRNLFKTTSVVCAPLMVLGVTGIAHAEQAETPKTELIAVYLKPQSKELMNSFLQKRGIKNAKVDYIAIHGSAKEEDAFVFRPLFGERAAFRLTGLLTLESGAVVGTGRLSNMIGEIKVDDREIAMPIFEQAAPLATQQVLDEKTQRLLDAPTLLRAVPQLHEKSVWRGRIPASKVGDVQYPAQKAQFVRIPAAEQVVVDGYLCSNKHCSAEGVCEYDRSAEVEQSVTRNESAQKEVQQPVQKSAAPDAKEEEEETCPVCRYMKGGPCKDHFVQWDGCIKSLKESDELRSCFAATKIMMYCMKDYEYYDIMTAGTDYAKLDQASEEKDDSPPASE